MDAAGTATRLRETLLAAGAPRGVVACRVPGSGPATQAWGGVCASSAFEAGSVTKPVTGLLLALAVEAGEVSSSDRLDRFLPGTGAAGRATLVRALAHPSNPYRGVSLDGLIRDARWARRRSRGTAAYSNLGVALLGQALAAAAALPYWDLARTRVLTPLGMTSSGDLPTAALAVPAGAWTLGAFAPAGGLRATAADVLRLAWIAARPGESPFPAAAVAALTPRAPMNNGYVGWCWMIRPSANPPVAWHNGATGAGWAFIGASSSGAIAACVPAAHRPAWDSEALRALSAADAVRGGLAPG